MKDEKKKLTTRNKPVRNVDNQNTMTADARPRSTSGFLRKLPFLQGGHP